MNRNQEYADLMQTMEPTAYNVQNAIQKARQRNARRVFVYRPLASVAAFMLAFVLLVNFSAPVAQAFSQVPILRDLAAAVTFSRSLTDAVENEYAQPMGLIKTQNGVTAEIAYLIVDQRQVNVFYTLTSDQFAHLEADPSVLTAEGNSPKSCMYYTDGLGAGNGELRRLTIDFGEGDVPEALRVQLNVYSNAAQETDMTQERNARDGVIPVRQKSYIVQFNFLLEFDAGLMAAGEVFDVHHAITLDGQTITITQVEVYPTHIQVKVEEDTSNTAWLTGLEFYIETDQGQTFEPVSRGITATGGPDTPSMVSYRADSTYFHDAEHLSVVVTGAQWLRKDMERTRLNLRTGETGALPDGVTFESAEKNGADWTVTFRVACAEGEPLYPVFRDTFYDADDRAHTISAWNYTHGEANEPDETPYFLNQFTLNGVPDDEVWLCPQFSHMWVADDALIVTVK